MLPFDSEPPTHASVVIVGGGPVGLSLAHALEPSGARIVVLEAEADGNTADPRMLALSIGSARLLRQLQVWPETSISDTIKTVSISQQRAFGRLTLNASDLKPSADAIGYVVPYARLQNILIERLPTTVTRLVGARAISAHTTAKQAEVVYGYRDQPETLTADLVVIADGGHWANQALDLQYQAYDYQQTALLARVKAQRSPPSTAFERFLNNGAIALLPQADGYALIWVGPTETIERRLALTEMGLIEELQQHMGSQAGRFLSVQSSYTFPLRLRYLKRLNAARAVAIGQAAQTLHPIAGQGFNLGLRDAWELASCLRSALERDWGHPALLAAYQRQRRLDRLNGIYFTDGLVRLFSKPQLAHFRGAGLALLDWLPLGKQALLRHLAFGLRSS